MNDRIVCVRCGKEGHHSSTCTVPVPGAPDMQVLTPRQRQVLVLVSQGYEDKEVAKRLNLSPQTVKDRLSLACRNIGARNRTSACVLAVRRGLI